MRRSAFVPAIVLPALLTALAGCGLGGAAGATGAAGEAGAGSAAGRAASGQPVIPAEAAHIHGIGRNPADGKLYVGTHTGLYAVGTEGVRKVGKATIDLMGFAVAGPDHFLASGHPGPDDDLPNPVGLIETRDGGQTWRPLSRAGESDFHALAAVGEGQRVYAFDGALRISDDGGRTWQQGADGLLPAAVAASPADPDTLLATTERGPLHSADGGRSFHVPSGAPVVVFLAWADSATVWGVDPAGNLHVSEDAGATWQPRGATGAQPQAITADPDGVTVVTAERVVTSTDGQRFSTLAELEAAEQ